MNNENEGFIIEQPKPEMDNIEHRFKINFKQRYGDNSGLCFKELIYDLARDIHALQDHMGYYSIDKTVDESTFIPAIILMNRLGLIGTEVSEAIEGVRKGGYAGLTNTSSPHIPEFDHLTEELADIVIRVLDTAGYLKVPLGEAIIAKLEFIQNNSGHRKDKII